MSESLRTYRKIAENLYPNSISNSGIPLEEIELTEKQFGFRFPEVLRKFYLLVGNHESINYAHNALISIDCLEIEDNRLIFYSENQGVCYWGIDLEDIAKDDPPIWQGQSIENQDEVDWHLATESLSDFLLIMLCWQSVMGGLPFVASADRVENSIIQAIKDNFSQIEIGKEYSGLQAFLGEGQVICLANADEEATIYAGTSDKNKFLEMENLLQIEWDYSSLDE